MPSCSRLTLALAILAIVWPSGCTPRSVAPGSRQHPVVLEGTRYELPELGVESTITLPVADTFAAVGSLIWLEVPDELGPVSVVHQVPALHLTPRASSEVRDAAGPFMASLRVGERATVMTAATAITVDGLPARLPEERDGWPWPPVVGRTGRSLITSATLFEITDQQSGKEWLSVDSNGWGAVEGLMGGHTVAMGADPLRRPEPLGIYRAQVLGALPEVESLSLLFTEATVVREEGRSVPLLQYDFGEPGVVGFLDYRPARVEFEMRDGLPYATSLEYLGGPTDDPWQQALREAGWR